MRFRLESICALISTAFLASSPVGLGQDIITTIAGGKAPIGKARSHVYSPGSVVSDRAGKFYFTDYNTSSVYKQEGALVRRVAGNGFSGFAGDNGPAIRAELGATLAIALDSHANLFIADAANNRIRRVDASTHVITTVAGNGTAGFAGDGGPATAAEINNPNSPSLAIAVSRAGEILIADAGNCVIRKVNASGKISTVAGTTQGAGTSSNCGYGGDGGPGLDAKLNVPIAVALDAAGNLFIADSSNNRIRRVDAKTGIITTAAGNGRTATTDQLNGPNSVAFDSAGNLFISDSASARIRRVDHTTGEISTVAGNGTQGFQGDGGPASLAELSFPSAVTVDPSGNLLIADIGSGRIRRVDAQSSVIATITGGGHGGDGRSAKEAELGITPPFVTGIAVSARGDVFFTDNNNNRIRKIDHKSGIISSFAGDPSGALGFSGDGGPATRATLGFPGDVAIDAAGNVYVEDFNSARIRRIDAQTGVITTVAGNGKPGFSGDGGPATSAALGPPEGIGVDSAGNLFIPDTANSRIRRVDAVTGVITTVAGNGESKFAGDGGPAVSASLSFPLATAVDKQGNLYIVDSGNNRLRIVSAATGIISTVAGISGSCGFSGDGGPASAAAMCKPAHVAVDQQGNLFISDTGNNRIRRVDHATRIISTVAGNGTRGFSGDGGPADKAALNSPQGIAVDSHGVLYILDTGNSRIRKVEPSTP